MNISTSLDLSTGSDLYKSTGSRVPETSAIPHDHVNILAGLTTPANNFANGPYVEATASSIHGDSAGNIVRSSAIDAVDDGEEAGSFGTLMLSKEGRSKYLGPTAGSEWLKDSEVQDVPESAIATRPPTPEPGRESEPQNHQLSSKNPVTFPFNASTARISTRALLARLPEREEAWTLVEAYYRYCAWHHDVAPKSRFINTFDRVYQLSSGLTISPRVDPQEIALVFIILAQDWLHLAELALVKGEFLSNNMVAGLQTLHLMAHLHLQMDKGRRGDCAWPIWGLVMRLVQAMGMHRDGTRWNLNEELVEQRHKVFWELNAADTFQAHCFSRPCAINPDHCDTAFPTQPLNLNGDKTYSILRYELSQLSAEILNITMKVRKPPYSDVTALDMRLQRFEDGLPFSLRCRAALLTMPSRYPQASAAVQASPEPSRRSMTSSFQQTNLAINISETIINLHRPYFAKALHENIDDRVKSPFATSFLTVIERCAIIIAVVNDIHGRFPYIAIRQWNFWYHVFGSALCLGTLLVHDPRNSMSQFVLEQLDAAIDLFVSLVQHGAKTPRYQRNLQWLLKLRKRIAAKIGALSSPEQSQAQHVPDAQGQDVLGRHNTEEDAEDVELIGWRTRLISRVDQRHQTVRTIRLPDTPTNSQITTASHPPILQQSLQNTQDQLRMAEMLTSSTSLPLSVGDSTDALLHDFWDPLLLQDVFEPSNNHTNPYLINGSAWWEDPMMAAPTVL